jgi:putative Holliday junction resolvase
VPHEGGVADSDRPAATALVFDYGARRIGVATANRTAGLASALTTLPARAGEPDWPALDALVAEWAPDVLVVGVPLGPEGEETPMVRHARAFADTLHARYGKPVTTLDERLTSAEASDRLRERRRSGAMTRRVRTGDVDAEAARLLGESWLRG